jgi:hypothetical protein
MNSIEPLLGFLVWTTVDGKLQLREGAGFGVRKLTETADPEESPNRSNRTSAKCIYLRKDF